MNAPHSDRGPMLSMAAMGTATGVMAVLWLAVAAGTPAAGQSRPGNPFGLVAELATGQRAWPGGRSTLVAAGAGGGAGGGPGRRPGVAAAPPAESGRSSGPDHGGDQISCGGSPGAT